MSNKTKIQTTSEKINQLAAQAGLIILAGAATIGMVDTPDHFSNRVAVPNQPAFAMVNNNSQPNNELGNNMQREREEVSPHYISYSIVQRTAGRSGKR